jgi:hypothetical protein
LPINQLFATFAKAQVGSGLWSDRSRPFRSHERVGQACWRWPSPSQ